MSESKTALARQEPSGVLAHIGYGREQIDLIKQTVARGATDLELAFFLSSAKRLGLDPLTKQIHFVKRKQNFQNERGEWVTEYVGTIQTGIDGFRALAERTTKYDGQDEPEYEVNGSGELVAARVRVYRKDISRPFVGVAYWSESVQTKADGAPNSMWRRMPRLMLAKVAEALAFRKAFPQDLSGVYTTDELPIEEGSALQQQPAIDHGSPPAEAAKNVTPAEAVDVETADRKALVRAVYRSLGVGTNTLTAPQMQMVVAAVAAALNVEPKPLTKLSDDELRAYLRLKMQPEPAAEAPAETLADAEAVSTAAQGSELSSEAAAGAATLSADDEMVAWVEAKLREHGVAEDDADVVEICGQISVDAANAGRRESTTYNFRDLGADDLRTFWREVAKAKKVSRR